jgi:hypothetical protein
VLAKIYRYRYYLRCLLITAKFGLNWFTTKTYRYPVFKGSVICGSDIRKQNFRLFFSAFVMGISLIFLCLYSSLEKNSDFKLIPVLVTISHLT